MTKNQWQEHVSAPSCTIVIAQANVRRLPGSAVQGSVRAAHAERSSDLGSNSLGRLKGTIVRRLSALLLIAVLAAALVLLIPVGFAVMLVRLSFGLARAHSAT